MLKYGVLKRFGLFFCAILLAGSASAAQIQRRLMMIGGGQWPAEAPKRFMEWSGGDKARILVVAWATEDPQGSFEHAKEQFKGAEVELAVSSDTLAQSGFSRQLARATGVWFSGGDQVGHMKALLSNGGAPLEAVRKRFAAGIPFGGTSAGTAVMSKIMITGEGDFSVIDGSQVETGEGLGFLEGFIVDQHFVKRSRQNRLFGLMLKHRDHAGLGVDEDTALAVEGDRGEVLGAGVVMVVHPGRGGHEDLSVELLRPGQRYDLKSKGRMSADAP